MDTLHQEGNLSSGETGFQQAQEIAGSLVPEQRVEQSPQDKVYTDLVGKVNEFGEDRGDGLYCLAPTPDPEFGTVQLDTYLNFFHKDPKKAVEEPILGIQRADGAGDGPSYNYYIFPAGDLKDNFLVESIADAAKGHKAGERVVVAHLDTGEYAAIDPRSDKTFQEAVRYLYALR